MSTSIPGQPALDALLAEIAEDDGVLGAVLTGSQARNGMVTAHSDADVFVIVADEARSRWHGLHSEDLDIAVFTFEDLRQPPLPGEDIDGWWNRYAFTHARVLEDRLDGGIQILVDAQGSLTIADAEIVAKEYLDGYLNFAVRSLRSERDGRDLEARLDVTESIPYLLTTIFAIEQRIRPYNKYLLWEIARYPLIDPAFSADTPPTHLRLLATGQYGRAQRDLFALVEPAARAAGLGSVIDAWGDDLSIFGDRTPGG